MGIRARESERRDNYIKMDLTGIVGMRGGWNWLSATVDIGISSVEWKVLQTGIYLVA
jgi:hypothetical protein